jgi:glycoside hydrolase-like protein/putative peptidoglycan binding protein
MRPILPLRRRPDGGSDGHADGLPDGSHRRTRLLVRAVVPAVVTVLVAAFTGMGTGGATAASANPVTPGNFTGYAFDQCTAPTQSAMDAWRTASPYWGVGIYISGASRGCTQQPNLTPTWVRTQLARGWRLLPVTLGPQAWCTTRERYLHQVRINPSPASSYARARAQGRAEARKTVAAAQRLGIRQGSTLWYDIEAFDISRTDCRESALSFLSAWTWQLYDLHYVSGVYSSAASGIKMLDDARATRPGAYLMPKQIWIGDWNGRGDQYSSYIRSTGWMPHRRVHQFRGGHDETYGGVRINIDTNWVDLGRGSWISPEPAHCHGAATYDFGRYASRRIGDHGALVRTLQCMLGHRSFYSGPVNGVYDAKLGAAVSRYRTSRGIFADTVAGPRTWTALLSQGPAQLSKIGSASVAVRRLQRALNAADHAGLRVSGVFGPATTAAVRAYQTSHRMVSTGIAGSGVWRRLRAGVI